MVNKVFIISGASSGLGKAMKNVIINKSNHKVISLSRKQESSDLQNDRVEFVACDLYSTKVAQCLKNIRLDGSKSEIIFINNAAVIEPLQKVGEMTEEEINYHFQVNVASPISLINAVVGYFNRGPLTIINISSGASTRPISNWSLYCASKASLEMFCKVLCKEHPSINISSVDPGALDTNMQKTIRNSRASDVENYKSLKNEILIDPEQAALNILSPFL